MAWTLALALLAAIPVFAALFRLLTAMLPPLAGYALGLVLYWAFLAGILVLRGETGRLAGLRTTGRPGRLLTAALLLPVLGTGAVAMAGLGAAPAAGLLLLPAAAGAILNAGLEEAVWRGALIPRPDRAAVATALALFAFWHVAPLSAQGILLPGGPLFGPVLLLAGAAVLGGVWMWARLSTGHLGAGALSHAGVNLFAFTDLLNRNLA